MRRYSALIPKAIIITVVCPQGKRLFRGVALAILFVVRRRLVVLRRKQATRDREAAEFQMGLPLYFEQCKAWVIKATKPTITSLLQVRKTITCDYDLKTLIKDLTTPQDEALKLDFHTNHIPLLPSILSVKAKANGKRTENKLIKIKVRILLLLNKLFWRPIDLRLIKYQVRIKGIITGICAEVPPTTILHILTGFYSDGIYYPPHFLFDSEKTRLDFNELGATRAMIRPLLPQDNPTDPRYLREVNGTSPECCIFAMGG